MSGALQPPKDSGSAPDPVIGAYVHVERDPTRLFATAAAELEHLPGGVILLRSPRILEPYSRCVGEWLIYWAGHAPGRIFLAEREPEGAWRHLTYGQALTDVERIAAWLLQHARDNPGPVAILSDNSIEQALLSLGAMHVGIPIVPISSAYSLVSKDFGKLKSIFNAVEPALVYAGGGAPFLRALRAVEYHGTVVASQSNASVQSGWLGFDTLREVRAEGGVATAFGQVGPDTVAKLLFTSGSTGPPKGVINTQRMLCANQQQLAQVWPFTRSTPPIIVDWLPWNHTFGGNYDFNLVLSAGGTLYIDEGRPTPAAFGQTIDNLREVPSTIHFNVPRGYDLLVTALQADASLRRIFFSKLQVLFYAAAALPQPVWEALRQLAHETVGEEIPIVSAWGSTETAPMATSCHYRASRAGIIGLPVPGCELKLLPQGSKLEVRVRGPQVTPGYWRSPQLTAGSFDAEGFYCIGDAVAFVAAEHPELGLRFDGRVSEDFKLLTGTWVNSGGLRIRALETLSPLVQDIVVAGHDRDQIGFLIFPNVNECRRLCPELADGPVHLVLAHAAVRDAIAARLATLRRAGTGSSTYASRALLMSEPPSIDAGEITDKGYINQSLVLARRAHLVNRLYEAGDPDVIGPPATSKILD